ncbi:MAG: hypothetical protein ACYTEP_02870 [Planctomycetota bacterium]
MRSWTLLLACGVTGVLGACGGQEAPPPIVEERPPWSAFAEARGMPDFEPATPLRHFRLTGDAVFLQEDRRIPQQSELWLAAPDRMRFRLGAAGEAPNIFLLSDIDHCWVKTPTTGFQDYPSLDLWKETLIRWHVLRFPWGWEDTIGLEEGLKRDFLLETELGTMTLSTDASGLPQQVHLRENDLSLGDWKASEGNGYLVPHRWDWTSELGRRDEAYVIIRSGMLYLDSAFRPEEVSDVELARLGAAEVEMNADNFDVVELELQYLTEEEWSAGSGWAPGKWWQHDGERLYLYSVGVGPQETAHRLRNRAYLWWATHQELDGKLALDQLNTVLPQLNVVQDGAIWVLEQDRADAWRRGFLLPVVRN